MLCSLIWLFTYSGVSVHTHTHALGKQNTHSAMWKTVIIFSSTTKVVVVAAVDLVGFHVVFRYNFFSLVFLFSYFSCAGTNICT